MIEVRHLTKRYGDVAAVRDLSFRVESGQTLALIGTSGCGKTTTLKMINRLVEPTSGTILVDGADVRQQPVEALRRRLGYVIQQTGLFPHYSVAENIGVVPRLEGWPAGRIEARVRRLLEQVGLPPGEYANKYPAQLSGGQQQRVGIARALAADPPIVLMDEPFGALDPITRRDIRRDFMEMEDLASKTVILVTHDVEEAFEMGDLICLLDRGEVQQLGVPKDLLFHPANAFVARFLAGRQLTLEQEVVTLAELFNDLPEPTPSTGSPEIFLAPGTTVRRALAQLSATGRNRPAAVQQDNRVRLIDLPGLLLAFSHYQRRIR